MAVMIENVIAVKPQLNKITTPTAVPVALVVLVE